MLPGSPLVGNVQAIPLYRIDVSADVTFDAWAAVGSPVIPVKWVFHVLPGVVRGAAALGDLSVDWTGFHEDSRLILVNEGLFIPKGGDAGSSAQTSLTTINPALPAPTSDQALLQHVSGGSGGAGSPGGLAGLGAPTNAEHAPNHDPGGADGNVGMLEVGGVGVTAAQNEKDGSDDFPYYSRIYNEPTDPENGSPAMAISCRMDIYNAAGKIFGSGGGGTQGWRNDEVGSPNFTFGAAGGDPGDGGERNPNGMISGAPTPLTTIVDRFPVNSIGGKSILLTTAKAEARFISGGVVGVDLKGDIQEFEG